MVENTVPSSLIRNSPRKRMRRSFSTASLILVLTLSSMMLGGFLSASASSHLSNNSEHGTPSSAYLAATVDAAKASFSLRPTIRQDGSLPFPKPSQTSASPASQSPLTLSTTGPSNVSIATSFAGLNQVQSCNCVPPDGALAAGPNYVVEMINLEGAIMSKTGTTVRFMSLSSFFATGSFFISDPKVLYDVPSQRWFASIIAVKSPNDFSLSNVTIAVSLTSDPTGFWNIYRINTAGSLPDQPIIGISSDKFVVSANMFQSGFLGAEYWVLSKAELVSGASRIDLASFGPNSSQIS